jgi:hypothetical protein
MSTFLESEKIPQAKFKLESRFISDPAREDGVYKGKPRPFCLPLAHAEENLIPEARQTALDHFKAHRIKWHDGQDGKPSNHLCDSQVCCVNFLFPFADRPEALATLLRPFFPNLKRMLPIEGGRFVSFEWIGARNYLGERMRPGSTRTRGANFTSADSVVMFESTAGTRQIVLIEWKYTESYGGTPLHTADSGTDRTAIYMPLYGQAGFPVDKALLPSFGALFYEPFYQLMRQQSLAWQMETHREMDADAVSLLHIAPARNTDFRRVTSLDLVPLGDTATGVWAKLVTASDRFTSVSTESLFGPLLAEPPKGMEPWADYIGQRYGWAAESGN